MKSRLLFFHGTCQCGIYSNMTTTVRTIFIRRDRDYRARNWLLTHRCRQAAGHQA